MENVLKKILFHVVLLFSILVALVFLAAVTLASLVLGMVLGVAWWKLALVIMTTVIVIKLLD